MLYLSIDDLTINGTAVVDRSVFELEHMSIDNGIASFLEDLEQSSFVFGVTIGIELSKGDEVFTVHSLIVLVLKGEGAEIEASLGS